MFSLGILTVSDKGARGERYDKSGKVIEDCLSQSGGRVVKYEVVPDEADVVAKRLIDWADSGAVDIILTTGGTGLGPRDVTPEATLSVIERAVPGIAEAMRVKTLAVTPFAMLSRAVAGIRKECLIINLPGSVKGASFCTELLISILPHAMKMMRGKGH